MLDAAAWERIDRVTIPGPQALSWMIDEGAMGGRRVKIREAILRVTPALCRSYSEAAL